MLALGGLHSHFHAGASGQHAPAYAITAALAAQREVEGDSLPPFSKAFSSEWGYMLHLFQWWWCLCWNPGGRGVRHGSVAQPVCIASAQGSLQNPDILHLYFSTIWKRSVFIMVLKSLLLTHFPFLEGGEGNWSSCSDLIHASCGLLHLS